MFVPVVSDQDSNASERPSERRMMDTFDSTRGESESSVAVAVWLRFNPVAYGFTNTREPAVTWLMMVPVVMVLERMTMRQIVVSLMTMVVILMRGKSYGLTCATVL